MGEEELDEPQRPLFRRDYFGLEETIVIVILIVVIVVFVLLMLSAFGEWSP